MATKQMRGTKRTCQSDECGARFYDLGRSPIVCPICGSSLVSGPAAAAVAAGKASRRFKRPEDVSDKVVLPKEIPEAAEDEQVALIDLDEEETVFEEEEPILEEEDEEDGDMSNIIDGPLDGDEKL